MNRLTNEKSAYLRHAASEKIDWHPWSEEAFEQAGREDKPLFMSSGAVWCHWCHVMAKECFYDDETAELLNRDFICIKLDRDERPDIDRRYQMAVSAMGSGGGWPLSVFLTHDKKPFYGGTYFPPEDRAGRPGFKKVLKAVLDLHKTKKDEIAQYTETLSQSLQSSPLTAGDLDKSQLDGAVQNILSELDPTYGGFGTAPKFPMPGAMEFLINRYALTKNEHIGLAIRKTLDSMAQGGFYDQLAGGFHRYSVDKAWIIPHFEKMADDNAWLLRNYVTAYAVFGDESYRDTAVGIIDFLREVLSDPAGGFFASQDADVTPDDEGGYFTWTDEELRKVLRPDEYEVLSGHLLNEAGSMHHDETKKVLFIAQSARDIARQKGKDEKEILEIIKRGKASLLQERRKRQTPFIDKTFYTSINGMLISACLQCGRILNNASVRDFALRSLDRITEMRFVGGELLHTDGVKAFLDDYVHLTDAFISAYEVTGNSAHLLMAERLMEQCIKDLWDVTEGGFFDSVDAVLGMKIKGIVDIPHPSGNSLAVHALLKLHIITNNESYMRYAEQALRIFAPTAQNTLIHAGYYFSALDAYFNFLKITMCAHPSSRLAETAISSYNSYMTIAYSDDRGYVIPCKRGVCYEPVSDPERLMEYLKK